MMLSRSLRNLYPSIGVMALATLMAGCATMPISKMEFGSLALSTPEPTQVVITMQGSALQENGVAKHTGMLCRAYFFAGNNPVPIKVAGDWTFTAYELPDGSPEKPQGLYRVAAKDLATHYRKDVVGDSYVFWFPYSTDKPADLELRGVLRMSNGRDIGSPTVKLRLDPVATAETKNANPPQNSTAQPSPTPTEKTGTPPPSPPNARPFPKLANHPSAKRIE